MGNEQTSKFLHSLYESDRSTQKEVKCVDIPRLFGAKADAFDHYVKVGRDMRVASEESKSSQVVREIEDILEEQAEKHRTTAETKGGKEESKPSYDDFTPFFALLAPSLSGKSQLAFALRRRRPLYFSCDQYAKNIDQPIYGCFGALNKALADCVRDDVNTLRRDHNVEFDKLWPSALLLDDFIPFWLLGLLEALILDGESHVGRAERNSLDFGDGSVGANELCTHEANDEWLKHFNRKRTFTIRPMSIADFIRSEAHSVLQDYVLFLDEFPTFPNSIDEQTFMRNLPIAVGLKVVCVGDENRHFPLVSRNAMESFGADKNAAWCVVLPNMPPPSPALVMRGRALVKQLPNCAPILRDFLIDQIQVSRGGVSHAIADAIEDILRDANCRLSDIDVLEGVLFRVLGLMAARKGEKWMKSQGARDALIRLCLGHHYDDEKPLTGQDISTAPVPESSCAPAASSSSSGEMVVTTSTVRSTFCPHHRYRGYRSYGAVNDLNEHYFKLRLPEGGHPNKIVLTQQWTSTGYRCAAGGRDKQWYPEICFAPNEVILQLASFLADLQPFTVREVAYRPPSLEARMQGFLPPENPTLDIQNLAHGSIIDSTHRSGYRVQGGLQMKPFLERVVANVISTELSIDKIEDASAGLLERIRGLSVPFLNAADLEWSEKLLELAEGCRGINLGRYRRECVGGIDASFELRIGCSEGCAMDTWYPWALVECKHSLRVTAGDYFRILEKGWRWRSLEAGLSDYPTTPGDQRTILHLTICSRLTRFKPSYIRSAAQANNWCAFAIRKKQGLQETLVVDPIIPPRTARPALVGIVIAMDYSARKNNSC